MAPADPLPWPQRDGALGVLARFGPVHGTANAGSVSVAPGVAWLSINCRGDGDLVLAFEPLGRFTDHCSNPVSTLKNQLNLVQEHQLTIMVTAPDTVEWSVQIQQ